MKKRGLIGLDLDGTVFDDNKQISKENKIAMEKAMREGFVVTPVTGRPMAGVPADMMAIGPMEYAVSSNGAVIYRVRDFEKEDWERIYEDMLPREKVLEVLTLLEDYPVVPDCFADGHGHMPEYARGMLGNMGLHPAVASYLLSDREFFPDLKEYVRNSPVEIEKITINFFMTPDGEKQKQAVAKAIRQLGGVSLVRGAPQNLEVNTETAKKGTGVLKLAQLLGIPSERTMACGDDENDLDMIRRVGYGVAMGNARDSVKAAADYITGDNAHSGVAQAIYHFMELCS